MKHNLPNSIRQAHCFYQQCQNFTFLPMAIAAFGVWTIHTIGGKTVLHAYPISITQCNKWMEMLMCDMCARVYALKRKTQNKNCISYNGSQLH